MTSKERVLLALAHKQPDRIPVYFGGTSSFLSDVAYFNLKDHLGIQGDVDPYRKCHTGTIYDPRILEALDVDVRFLVYNLENYGIRDHISSDRVIDEWGVPLVRSGEHWSRVDPPLEYATLAEMMAYPMEMPENHRNGHLVAQAKALREENKYGIVARSVHSASFLELGCWLRGFMPFFCDMAQNSPMATVLLDKVMEAQIAYYTDFLSQVGPYVDIVETSEDYGTQASMFVSPDTYRKLIQPRRMKINETIHKFAPQAKILHHTCGAVRPLIPDLINTGIDILNPIQPNLAGMDPAELKAEFGNQICFCGGIDMQTHHQRQSVGYQRKCKPLRPSIGQPRRLLFLHLQSYPRGYGSLEYSQIVRIFPPIKKEHLYDI